MAWKSVQVRRKREIKREKGGLLNDKRGYWKKKTKRKKIEEKQAGNHEVRVRKKSLSAKNREMKRGRRLN